MEKKLSLVALFYNEERSVEKVIRECQAVLRQVGMPFEIVAVQNGSTDGTPEILARMTGEIPELRIFKIEKNQGAGYGAVQGWYACKGDYVIGISGDGQVDIQAIPRMFELMLTTGSDVAYGRRRSRPDGFARASVSWLYQQIIAVLFQVKSKDMNGLPKILSRRVLDGIQIRSTGQFLECEMMLKVQKMGVRVCSVDVDFFPRGGGASSVGWRDCVDYLTQLATIRLGIDRTLGMEKVPRVGKNSEWIHCPNGVADLKSAAPALMVGATKGSS